MKLSETLHRYIYDPPLTEWKLRRRRARKLAGHDRAGEWEAHGEPKTPSHSTGARPAMRRHLPGQLRPLRGCRAPRGAAHTGQQDVLEAGNGSANRVSLGAAGMLRDHFIRPSNF